MRFWRRFRRSRLWWYRRMRRAYKKWGAIQSRSQTWTYARWARRTMPVEQQWNLKQIKRR